MTSRRLGIAALLLAALVSSGCGGPPAATTPGGQPHGRDAEGTADLAESHFTVGFSIRGAPLRAMRLGDGPTRALYLATIHGNETAGTPLLERLAAELRSEAGMLTRLGASVVILPVANPDGQAANRRGNSNGVDLNRNFPADNWHAGERGGAAPLSQPEARAIFDLISTHQPQVIVSLHQPLRCIDYDGPGRELAEAMAARCDLPLRKLGGRPGSLGSYAGETLGTPVITVELPRSADSLRPAELWDRYGEMLLAPLMLP